MRHLVKTQREKSKRQKKFKINRAAMARVAKYDFMHVSKTMTE